jgi:hypothetical protein
MRAVRRPIGVFCGVSGLIGLLLCIAGAAGCWMLHAEIIRRVDRTFGRAETSLADTRDDLANAGDRLRRTHTELLAIQKREADLASHPPAERTARRALSKKALDVQNPRLGEARQLLVRATEVGMVVNGLLDALAELQLVERLNIDAERLKSTSAQLSEATERSEKLADLLAKAAPDGDTSVAGESSRVAEALNRTILAVDGAHESVAAVRGKVEEGHSRINHWTTICAVVVTIVLFWIGLGQLSLLIHGGRLARRRPALPR